MAFFKNENDGKNKSYIVVKTIKTKWRQNVFIF